LGSGKEDEMTMTTLEPENEPMGRAGGLLKWWGIDHPWGPQSVSMVTEQLQDFLFSMREIYADACRRQLEVMNDANEHFSTGFRALLRSRSPNEAVEAEIALMRAIAEDVSAQCHAYLQLVGKLHSCVEDIRHKASVTTDEAKGPDAPPEAPKVLDYRPHSVRARTGKHVNVA
jgi:hypothetical protein